MSNSKHAVINIDGACINQGLPNAKAGYGVHWGENHQNNLSGRRIARLQVTLKSDSTYVRDAIAGASGFQSASPANRDLMQSIHDLSKGGRMSVHYEHVSGHSGDAGNDAAHRLANEGAKK
ncbi:hypothetical protein GCK72_013197 [Caenorhabditis remanei]|uniref:ribonuclease H n=1 Tax=Caenorhabditis remanei TaxID=31234 RepID=A0A6A5GQ67_CAERE|nr:hypothetical protein GCK72_013197 [Caenorhabditis remanei]KAF1756743.1 hypothetical protein GCK72_013197 [Caenorhabditis remanei]